MPLGTSHISLEFWRTPQSFTGSFLYIIGSKSRGVESIPAFSGKPGKYEAIPGGTYWIQTDEIFEIGVSTDLRQKVAFMVLKPGKSFWDACNQHMQAWGSFRIPIRQSGAQEIRTGRSAMFLHGGDAYGSAGCIDLQHWMDWFAGFLKKEHSGSPPQRIFLTVL